MLLEYEVAGVIGKILTVLDAGDRSRIELSGWARMVARGEMISARDLLRVQEFAVRTWTWSATVAAVLIFPLLGIAALVKPGKTGRGDVADVMLVLIFLAVVGVMQGFVLRFRSTKVKSFIIQNILNADSLFLPSGSQGISRWYDFWVSLAFPAFMFCVLLSFANF